MIKTFFSKQRWIIDKLPLEKMNADDLIREVLFNVFTDQIENKQLLSKFSWDDDEGSRAIRKEIDFCYSWIKEKRLLSIEKINTLNDEFPDVPEDDSIWKFVNENHIGELMENQKILFEKDNQVLKSIVGFREYLIEL
jgi:hypothetical protein